MLLWSNCKDLKLAFSKFFPNLNGFLSDVRDIINISKILMRVTRKVLYFLEIYEVSDLFNLQSFDVIFYFPLISFYLALN